MFICEICLFVWYFPQFCTSDMSKYGYLEGFSGSLRLRDNESRLYIRFIDNKLSGDDFHISTMLTVRSYSQLNCLYICVYVSNYE